MSTITAVDAAGSRGAVGAAQEAQFETRVEEIAAQRIDQEVAEVANAEETNVSIIELDANGDGSLSLGEMKGLLPPLPPKPHQRGVDFEAVLEEMSRVGRAEASAAPENERRAQLLDALSVVNQA